MGFVVHGSRAGGVKGLCMDRGCSPGLPEEELERDLLIGSCGARMSDMVEYTRGCWRSSLWAAAAAYVTSANNISSIWSKAPERHHQRHAAAH